MKKFISMVMAAAMVVSLVPATAFAANTAAFKVVDAIEVKEADADALELAGGISAKGAQIQLIIKDVDTNTNVQDEYEVTLEFDGIEAITAGVAGPSATAKVYRGVTSATDKVTGESGVIEVANVTFDAYEEDDTSITYTIKEKAGYNLNAGDVIVLQVGSNWVLESSKEGTVATVTVTGDFGDSEAMPFVSVLGEGLDVTVSGKPVEVAEEEIVELKKITVESVVGDFDSNDEVKVKVSKGFEIVTVGTIKDEAGNTLTATEVEDDYIKVKRISGDSFTIEGMEVEAVSAKAGDICTITVSCKDFDGDSDEAAEVIADAVIMSVDEDEDVPEIWAGTAVRDAGLTSDGDHKALQVTIEESVAGAWDTVKGWTLSLPEGVYVAAVAEGTDVDDNGNIKWKNTDVDTAFADAYEDGSYEYFDFGRRALEATDDTKVMEITLDLVLVAEPEFVGDVVLTLEGDALETQEVVIATFVAPYTVEAAANDLVIDYKETVVPTEVTITEAEEGLWATNTEFVLGIEGNRIDVEDATVSVNEDDSEMEIKDKVNTLVIAGADAAFKVTEESDEEVGVVTLSDVELYMQRNIPAGAYDLIMYTSMGTAFLATDLYGTGAGTVDAEHYDDIVEYDETVKEGWINVITAGRDQDDASFTKKVVVTVGANTIIAGEDELPLDVPAYINANGYTMLPVRAVAVALGINTNNVIWNQDAKQVTILYGQRVITMQVGSKVINVNGSAIPAAAAVEVVEGRAFLGLRDLATALGVVDITWDGATQQATLNGNK